jgi:hypothetical protein
VFHPVLMEELAKLELEERHKQAETRRTARMLQAGQPHLSDRALAALGDLMIETGGRLKERHAVPEHGVLGWE